MFQALAEVIRQQLPVFDERRAGRAKYFKKPNKGAVASRDKRTADAKIRVAEKDAAEAAAEAAAAATRPPALSEEEIGRQRKLEKKAEEERSELREAHLSWHAAIAYFRLRAEPTFGPVC